MRDDPPLAPDWLRIGTDIIDGGPPVPTFNGVFSLSGRSDNSQDNGNTGAQAQASAGGIPVARPLDDVTLMNQAATLFNVRPLAMVIATTGAQSPLSNMRALPSTDTIPAVTVPLTPHGQLQSGTHGLRTTPTSDLSIVPTALDDDGFVSGSWDFLTGGSR
jgi:hypothetical protein